MKATRVDEELVEAIAFRVVQLLDLDRGPREDPDLIDAAELARRFGMDRSWVYAHAAELGAVRLGEGPNARLRFDPARAREALNPVGREPVRAEARPRHLRRRRRRRQVALLPVKGVQTGDQEPA